jgi:GcrA cell cycle regulator
MASCRNNKGQDMSWTDERVSTLKKLWTEGLSANQIAKQLGGVTRNAVIGKVHRLGLAGRATPSRPAIKRPMRPTAPRSNPVHAAHRTRALLPGSFSQDSANNVIPFLPTLEALRQEDGSLASVLTLTERMCKWPIGDPSDQTFAFCGRTACTGPYCEDHARVAYQPQQQKRRRPAVEESELRRMVRVASR